MHKSLKKFGLAGVAMALAMSPAMVAAQDQAMPDTTTATPPMQAPSAMSTADQDTKVQSWPTEQQTAYKAWSPETQTYFWTLTEDRQQIFWRIEDSDKATLAAMAEPQREATWAELEARLKTLEG